MKALILASILSAPFAFPATASAGCYGTWDNSSYSGTCSGYSNGSSYRLNVDGGNYGSTRVNGIVDGYSVRGSVNGSTFRGTVDGRYVTCGRFGCY